METSTCERARAYEIRRTRRAAGVVAVSWLMAGAAVAAPARAKPAALGQVMFPTTGSEAAKVHFLRGVLALHSFWYEEAAAEFREATKIAPRYLMGYWGEAMTHYHPVWHQLDVEAGREVLRKGTAMGGGTVSKREDYLWATLFALYGPGDKQDGPGRKQDGPAGRKQDGPAGRMQDGPGDRQARAVAYADEMAKLHAQFPDDDEVTAFYAVALLGSVPPSESGVGARMRAGALALDLFARHPDHPGAAHYVIHAFDDPDHAVLALPAARRYAQIAPEAYHARHMPSHIFVQLGMWPEAVAACESAWEVSQAWVTRKKLDGALRDHHSLSWLVRLYLEQGRPRRAAEALAQLGASAAAGAPAVRATYADTLATYLMETNAWDRAPALLAPLTAVPTQPQAAAAGAGDTAACAAHTPPPGGKPPGADDAQGEQKVALAMLRSLIAAGRGDAAGMKAGLDAMAAGHKELQAKDGAGYGRGSDVVDRHTVIVNALLARARGNANDEIEALRKAIAREDKLPPPSGPTDGDRMAHDLMGEALLRAGKPKEAAAEFAAMLKLHPGRARSLLGSARAAVAVGDVVGAAETYRRLLATWRDAEPDAPGLAEAHSAIPQRPGQ